jgi:hypothetical protein
MLELKREQEEKLCIKKGRDGNLSARSTGQIKA